MVSIIFILGLLLQIPAMSFPNSAIPPDGPYDNDEFYVSFYDEGVKKEFRQTKNNVINDARSLYSFDTQLEMSLFYNSSSPVYDNLTISFQKVFPSLPMQYQADSLFTFQRYTYFGPPSLEKAAAVISYTDANGFVWTTQNTGNAQIGSFVNINSSFELGETGYRYTVKGTFTCLLYNTSSPGQYKNITNGSFTAKFGFGN